MGFSKLFFVVCVALSLSAASCGIVGPLPSSLASPTVPVSSIGVDYSSMSYLVFHAPDYCYFLGSNIQSQTLPPPSPTEWWNMYLAYNQGPNANWTTPPLPLQQTATVQVAVFDVQFNDTVFLRGRPINDAYWWDPPSNDEIASATSDTTSFTADAVGCYHDSADSTDPLYADPSNPFSYALLYRNTAKTPNKYCPKSDPYRRYPIWRDFNNAAYAAWQFEFDNTTTQPATFSNHMSPSKEYEALSRNPINYNVQTCGLPYYSFMVPYSPTVPLATILVLAQQMLPMPDDIVDNRFTIVHWMSSLSNSQNMGTDFAPYAYSRTYPSVIEMATTNLYFKVPNDVDWKESCATNIHKTSLVTDTVDLSQNQFSLLNMPDDTANFMDAGADHLPEWHDLIQGQSTAFSFHGWPTTANFANIRPTPAVVSSGVNQAQPVNGVCPTAYPHSPCPCQVSNFPKPGCKVYASCTLPPCQSIPYSIWTATSGGSPIKSSAAKGSCIQNTPGDPASWYCFGCPAEKNPDGSFVSIDGYNCGYDAQYTFGWCLPNKGKFYRKQDDTFTLKDKLGNSIQMMIAFKAPSSQPCNADDFYELEAEAIYLVNNLANAQDLTEAVLLQAAINKLHAKFGFSACFGYLQSLYTLKATPVSVPTPTAPVCTTNPQVDPVKFSNDPCCNPSAAFSQCCNNTASQQYTTYIYEIDTFNPAITAKCGDPTLAMIAVADFVATSRSLQAAPSTAAANTNDLAARFLSVQEDCYQKIHNASCSNDQDCFSGECDLYNKRCTVPYNALQQITISCLLENVETELRPAFLKQLQLPDGADDTTLANAFIAAVTDKDCTGPTSDQYRSRSVYDSRIGASVVVPGNQTGCTSELGCSFQTNAGGCFSDLPYKTNNFCGVCHGQSCWEISEQPKCIATALITATTCRAAGPNFYWLAISDQYFTEFEGECLNLAGVDEQSCLNPSICPSTGDFSRCSGALCYNKQFSTPATCKKNNGQWAVQWNSGAGLCAAALDLGYLLLGWGSYVCPAGFTPHYGYTWVPGKFATPTACAAKQCSLKNDWRFVGQDAEMFNAAQCAQYGQCTQGCPRCVGQFEVPSNPVQGIVCYNPNIVIPASSSTSAANKQCLLPRNYVVNGVSKTLIGNHLQVSASAGKSLKTTVDVCTYSLNANDCVSAGMTVVSCNQLNSDSCGTQVFSSTSTRDDVLRLSLGCSWDFAATCNSQAACEATGRCDDDEFVFDGTNVNGRPTTGGCVVKAKWISKSKSWQECTATPAQYFFDWLLQLFGINPSRFRYQRNSKRPGYCVDVTYTKQQCLDQGGEWDDRADSQTKCESGHGMLCKDLASGQVNSRAGDACTSCGGTIVPAYKWTPGIWYTGFMRDTYWKQRAMVPINQWETTVNYTKLDSLMNKVVAQHVASTQLIAAQQSQDLLSMINTLSSIVCDCTDGKRQSETPSDNFYDNTGPSSLIDPTRLPAACYNASNGLAPAIIGNIYNLVPSQWQTSGATYTVAAQNGGSTIVVMQTPFANSAKAAGLNSTSSPSSRRLLDSSAAASIEIPAVDSNGVVAGMVVGRGQSIVLNVLPGSLSLAFNVDGTLVNSIDRSIYYLPAVAQNLNGRIEIIDAQAVMENHESVVKTEAIYSTGEYYAVFAAGPKRVVPAEFLPPVASESVDPPISSAHLLSVSFASVLSVILVLISMF